MNVWTYSTLALIFGIGVVVIACALMAKGKGDE